MLTEKEKEMLASPLSKRDPISIGNFDIQDVMEVINAHTDKMTPIDDTTVSISLGEITAIIFDALMLGYTRGKESK